MIEGTDPVGEVINVMRFKCQACGTVSKAYEAQQKGCTKCEGRKFNIVYVPKDET